MAIQSGVVLSALLFMRRMETVTRAGLLRPEEEDEEGADPGRERLDVPEGVELFEINGPFFFGAAGKFQDEMAKLKMPRVLILILRDVPAIDATGLRALDGVCRAAQRDGTVLLIAGICKQPAAAMKKAGLTDRIGHANVHKDPRKAILHARRLLENQSA